MPGIKDIAGKHFGRLTGHVGKNDCRASEWLFRFDCERGGELDGTRSPLAAWVEGFLLRAGDGEEGTINRPAKAVSRRQAAPQRRRVERSLIATGD
jgi:hypothetical protein